MPLSYDDLRNALADLDLTFETDGKVFLHVTSGRYAESIRTIITLDADSSGATILSTLPLNVPQEKRSAICELLNLVHGQNLWHFRFHLDDEGQLMSIGKVSAWGKSFNPTQFGDIFFTVLVTIDRLAPCLSGVLEKNQSAPQAFESFFLQKTGEG